MEFTLDQLLTLVGRLDDSPGFDTPRERFRRFLLARMTDLQSAESIVRGCREHSGEQIHRALQDAVTVCGRLLGFDTAFGRYHHDPGAMPQHGKWHARHRLDVALVLCTDQTSDIDIDTVVRETGTGDAERGAARIALLVGTSRYAARLRLEQTAAVAMHPRVRLISLTGLLRLCAAVTDGRLTHDDVLQVLHPPVTLDMHLDLLARLAGQTSRAADGELPASPAAAAVREPRYWVNAMRPDPPTATDRIVRSLVASRRILGIKAGPGVEDRVRPGDRIAVYLSGRGIVAHAQIAGMLADGSGIIRDSKRFTHVLRLADVTVCDPPTLPSPELTRKLEQALAAAIVAVTIPVSSREFQLLTTAALSQAG